MKKRIADIALFFVASLASLQVCADDGPEFGSFEPNVAYPHGRPNPNAPEELSQFAFMIGVNECNDEIIDGSGDSTKFSARWNAHYFLNGYGIQDQYWTPDEFVTSNIRIFDPKSSSWKVTFFGYPAYSSGVWEGGQEGDNLILRQFNAAKDGTLTESRLTFYNIKADSFDWKAENVKRDVLSVSWTSSCRKVRS